MIKRVLKNKLVALGYAATYVENKIKEFEISVDATNYTESELNQKIKVLMCDKPTTEVPKFFLNINGELVDKFLFDGKLNTFTKLSAIGSQISLLDYPLAEKLCIIGLTKDADILILLYMPSKETLNRYSNRTYEDLVAEERDSIVIDYMEALTSGNRLSNIKAKDVIYVLLSEFVIDTILVENSNPRLKLYDNASKFAENITNYEYKYINRKINRIEFVEKYIDVRFLGFGVKIGNISNDPYLLLKEVNNYPDFYLNRPTYAWLKANNKGQEEIAIYTANEMYSHTTYKEMMSAREDIELKQEANKLTSKFSSEMGYQISGEYIFSVLKKLNRELIILPIDFIRMHNSDSYEYIEPLRYRFTTVNDKKEFEDLLYNSIDDNLNGRYRYRFVEKLSGIYMTIGNKLNYTDNNGKIIRKQSVADFNINFNAAIVKRETLIDVRAIPQLLGFMYKDIDDRGTEMLPVPSIEVVFYFPEVSDIGNDVEMYNGTAIDVARGDGFTAFNEIGLNKIQHSVVTKPKDPNEKYIVVKYVNSNGEILKENIIRNVMVGSTHVPDTLPVINDREGKEWICEPNQLLSINVSMDNSKNEIEVKYIKKMARIRINYINKQGSELIPPVIRNMQVGEVFDMGSVKKFIDASKVEWNLYQSKPNRFIVSEDETENVLTLVYDVVKADVFIYFKTRNGIELKPADKIVAVANKEFSAQIVEKIIDETGLTWKYAQDSKATIDVKESDTNEITFIYDEMKKRVVTHFVDEKGTKIKDDLVEIHQVGSLVEAKHDIAFVDIYKRRWKFKNLEKDSLRVSENEQENVLNIVYEKLLSTITVSMVNEAGQKLREDIFEKAQIGSVYTPNAIKEIEDQNGRLWECVEKEKSLTIDESEIKNKVTYKYKPLMSNVYIQYVDVEGRTLLPQKEKELQVGSIFIPDIIATLQDAEQKVWEYGKNNVKEYKIKKHKEENIIKINYDRKLVDIKIVFKDFSANVLKNEIIEKAQLGSEYVPMALKKITSDNGERWMLSKTEPSKMFVKENSTFELIYDEIKAKVIIKCINISDSKSIIDDTEYITKLGGVYVPNIHQKIVDKLKHRWTYVGEPGMSIITKENEQENIITLKYEPDRANVVIKFLNKNQQAVHKDVVNAEQIGSEVAIKEFEKIIEENGFGWKLKNMSRSTLLVNEDESKNVVICNYEPLLVPVTTRYIDEQINEITTSKIDTLQVGEKFNPIIIPKITDANGKVWSYSNIKVVELTVKDEPNNKVNIKYIPLKKNVVEKFVTLKDEVLTEDSTSSVQVGEIYLVNKRERVTDREEKSWIYQKSSVEKIKVLEEEEKNIIINYYDKELTNVVIKYQTTDGVTLAGEKVLQLQIGSSYEIQPKETLEDENKLTWKLSSDNKLNVKISRDSKENIFIVTYDKYMVNVYDKYINEATGEEVIKPSVSKQQVGSSYLVAVKERIVDDEGKHWVQAAKSEIKIFTSNYKVEPITVLREEARNVTIVKYKPMLVETTIRYQDSLGRQIKMEDVKKLQVGSMFSEEVPLKIIDNLGNKWSYNPNSNSEIKISENPKDNVVVLAYEEQKSNVIFKYLDKAGNELQESTLKLVQIGNSYTPQFETIITDKNGCVWEYSERNREKIEVKEDDKENIVELTYIPLNVDVTVTYLDLWGNEIVEAKTVKAQLGSEYKPIISGPFTNDKSLLYKLVKTEPKSIKVKEIPIGKENPNNFKLTFEPINSNVIIIFQDLDGNALRDEERVNLQVGSKYAPKPSEFIKDKKGNEWHLVNAQKDEITVQENEKENVIKFIYEVAKADIIVRTLNVDGLVICPEERMSKQVGTDFVPSPEPFVYDNENKKWRLLRIQPVNLKVGSINNIVTVIYQEEKTKVTWEYCDDKGNTLRASEKHEVQIGARYTPIVSNRVIYDDSQIWRLMKIEPYEIIISENAKENIVKLIYSNAKVEEKVEKKKEIINPFANTMTENTTKEVNSEIIDAPKTTESNITPNTEMLTKNNNVQEEAIKETYEFEDEHLKKLARSMALSESEKASINKLNEINAELMNELQASKETYYNGNQNFDYTKAEEIILKEKEMIKSNFESLISKDTSGARLLKIFEHIVASESNDAIFAKLQQRRAVLITDYFLDKPLTDMDKVLYICERGKNSLEIELINKKISQNKIQNLQDAMKLKTMLYYEKLMLDNYYKARNVSNDNYFIDSNVKAMSLPDIVIGVTNLLVKQALNILSKENIDFDLRNELEAIISLCTPQQIASIQEEVNKFDGKTKRNANKMIQEILKGK